MAGGRLGIIAGGGDLPRRLAEHARASGRDAFFIALKGFADPDAADRFEGGEASIGEIGKTIRLLRKAGCKDIVFAGSVRRPTFSIFNFDFRGAMLLPALIRAAAKGDDALLRVVVHAFERAGFCVVGADDILAALLAPAGTYGRHRPGPPDWLDIRVAAEAAIAIGMMDAGQGAVARNGALLATESDDGTDAMLRRVTPPSVVRSGVLVKRPKPMQEHRIDLPTIGVATVLAASNAGLSGIAVEAGGALVVDRADVARLADELGLFVYGFSPSELA
jgi:UDP-2,3-diacylglucosamine hydrolase